MAAQIAGGFRIRRTHFDARGTGGTGAYDTNAASTCNQSNMSSYANACLPSQRRMALQSFLLHRAHMVAPEIRDSPPTDSRLPRMACGPHAGHIWELAEAAVKRREVRGLRTWRGALMLSVLDASDIHHGMTRRSDSLRLGAATSPRQRALAQVSLTARLKSMSYVILPGTFERFPSCMRPSLGIHRVLTSRSSDRYITTGKGPIAARQTSTVRCSTDELNGHNQDR